MSLNKVPAGRDVPNDFNVIIEIPMNADPIKYEVDKESGAIFVDRFMGTAMHIHATTVMCLTPFLVTVIQWTFW